MRGFSVPPHLPSIYWECARVLLSESNPHTFLEWLLLGPDNPVTLHLLIPTQLGMCINDARNQAVNTLIEQQHSDKSEVLKKQQSCLLRCVKCLAEIPAHPDRFYQVVLRVANGQSHYDFFFCFFCSNCQTVKTCALFKSSEAIYEAFSACVEKYAFCKPLNMNASLMDAYLERFITLNAYTSNILEQCMHVSRYCYHCGKQVKKLKACSVCGVVRFCKRGECLKKATLNGHQQHVCRALCEMRLFHVEDALFVDTEVLPCNRYQWIPPQKAE